MFAELDAALQQAKIENYKFTIVGDGGERNWLENNLKNANFTGEIRGEELAETIANMDLNTGNPSQNWFGVMCGWGFSAIEGPALQGRIRKSER